MVNFQENGQNIINKETSIDNLIDLLIYRGKQDYNSTPSYGYTFLSRFNVNGINQETILTYRELDQRSRAIAAKLQYMGAAGENILLMYPAGLEFISAFFGCLYAATVAIPAYPLKHNQKMSRLEGIVRDAQPKIVLTTRIELNKIEKRFSENPELSSLVWIATDELGEEWGSSWQKPEVNSNTLALLQYTSGSTGNPKGVMITHGNLLHNQQIIKLAFGHNAKSVVVGWLPLFHDMGLVGNVLQPLYLGVPCILMSPVHFLQKPIRWLQAISHYKATTSGGPNFGYEACLQKIKPEQIADLDLSSWNVAFSGAEPVRAETIERFAATFAACGFKKEAFYPSYGMAETTLFVSGGLKKNLPIVLQVKAADLEEKHLVKITNNQEESLSIVGCGKTRLDMKVIIVDPESLTQCPQGKVGEIWVSGSSVGLGYWNQLELTQQTFQAYLADTKEGPFLRTGDLGFLQDDELFITGRIKDLIIIRGQNHYPQDIELTVQNTHQALRPNCGAAFTVEIKGEERLVIVQEIERSYLGKLDDKKVMSSVCQAVIAQHSLAVYGLVLVKTDSIPKTSSGKIQRHLCRHNFLEGTLNVIDDWSENPLHRTKFKNLNTEIEYTLQKLKAQLISSKDS